MKHAVAVCATLIGAVVVAPTAHAEDAALNGRFRATSNGEWATTNDVYRNEATVQSTWTIAMTCINDVTCSGTVTSDAGWTAPVRISNGEYIVKRDLPDWEPCGDGRKFVGHQSYRFFPVGEGGFLEPGSGTFAGFDKTSGDSGACSINERLEIEIPFSMQRLD
jgi:hypothetical protein